jgi:hypothetical protein
MGNVFTKREIKRRRISFLGTNYSSTLFCLFCVVQKFKMAILAVLKFRTLYFENKKSGY